MEPNETIRFRIQITAKDLWMFSMYHSNKGYLGVFNLFFTGVFMDFSHQMVGCDRGVPDPSSDLRADVHGVAASPSLYEGGQTG